MTAPISDDLEDGIVGKGFPDRGLQRARRRRRLHVRLPARLAAAARRSQTAATWANACGAFAVSRLLCAPEYPTCDGAAATSSKHGSPHRALRKDEALNHIHWATTRRRDSPVADGARHRPPHPARGHRRRGRRRSRRASATSRCWRSRRRRASPTAAPGYGMLLDEKYGRDALFEFARHGFSWLGRPVELPGSRPLRFEFGAGHRLAAGRMAGRPLHQVPVLLPSGRSGRAEGRAAARSCARLFEAARKVGRELLIEIIAGKHGALDDDTIAARAGTNSTTLGIKPDWWKLEPQASPAAWATIEAVIARHDPWCRGVVLLGLEAPQAELEARLRRHRRRAASSRASRSAARIFADAARTWLAGTISDEAAIADMAARFERLTRGLACRARPESGIDEIGRRRR